MLVRPLKCPLNLKLCELSFMTFLIPFFNYNTATFIVGKNRKAAKTRTILKIAETTKKKTSPL